MLTAIKGEINSNKITLENFNTSPTPMDRSFRHKTNRKTQDLNDTLDQIDLIDIYRAFHLKPAEYIFISSVHGTFSRIDYILGRKSSLSKFKKIEIVLSIFSNHNILRLDINYRGKKNPVKNPTNSWRLNIMLLNKQQITEEIIEEIKKKIPRNKGQ